LLGHFASKRRRAEAKARVELKRWVAESRGEVLGSDEAGRWGEPRVKGRGGV
jgi:hypothetical protein